MDQNKLKPIMIQVPVSLGELLDKISILQVKIGNLPEEKLIPVIFEYNLLKESLEEAIVKNDLNSELLYDFLEEMVKINANQWEIEDKVRELRKKNNFGEEYLLMTERISNSNRYRIETKNKINIKFGSNIEVKSYYGEK